MSFIMIFLLLDSSLVNAAVTDTFGYKSISVFMQEDGSKKMEVVFDSKEISSIKEVKVYTNLLSYERGEEELINYKTYTLNKKSENSFVAILDSSEMRHFGFYYVNKIEIIKNDDSKKVIFNSLFNESLSDNDPENGILIEIEEIFMEESKFDYDEEELAKRVVRLGEDQTFTFSVKSFDKQAFEKEVYVSFYNGNEEQVIKAELNEDGKYQAILNLKNSLQTGMWSVDEVQIKDNFNRTTYLRTIYQFKVASDNADIISPEIQEIKMINGNVYDGLSKDGKPYFKIKASDDVAGISQVSITFNNKDKFGTYSSTAYVSSSGEFSVQVPSKVGDGNYFIQRIKITDKADNSRIYINETLKNDVVFDFGDIEYKDFSEFDFKVINNEIKGNIQVISVEKNFDNASNGYDLDFSITYKSSAKLSSISSYFVNEKYKRIYISTSNIIDNNDGTYTAKFIANKNSEQLKYCASGNYKVEYIYSYINNSNVYVYNGEGADKYNFSDLNFTCNNINEDIKSPSISNINLDKLIVTPGEKVKITIEADDDISGISTIYCRYGFMDSTKTFTKVNNSSNTYEVELEIPTYTSTGVYRIKEFYISDKAGNYDKVNGYSNMVSTATILVKSDLNELLPPKISSNIDNGSSFINSVIPKISTDHGTIEMELDGEKYDGSEIKTIGTHTLYVKATGLDGSTTTAKFTFKVVAQINEDTKIEDIVNQIINSEESNIQIDVNTKDKVVSKEIFESIRGIDKSVTFKQEDGTEWTFNGKDIKDETNISDIKISVKSAAEDKEAAEAINDAAKDARIIHFDYHGDLPGKASVKIYVGDREDLKGKDLTFYYYNADTKKIEKVQGPLAIDTEGFVTVQITHCSDYFLSAKDDIVSIDDETIINLTTKSLKLNIGDTTNIGVSIENQGDNEITYSIVDKKIASVDSKGTVKALAAGNTQVKVECNGVAAFVDIIVNSNANNNVVIVPDNNDYVVTEPNNITSANNEEENKTDKSENTKTGDAFRNIGIMFLAASLSAAVLVISYKKKKSFN